MLRQIKIVFEIEDTDEAENMDEAKEIAKEKWTKHFGGCDVPNMFHLKVRKLKDTEEFLYNYFKRIECEKDF